MSEKLAGFAGFKQNVSTFWHARTSQERKIICIGAILLFVAIFYFSLINPAISGRAQLAKDLPALRLDAAEMRALSNEATQLAGKAVATIKPMTKESLELSMSQRGLKAQSITMTGAFAKIQLSEVPFGAVLNWLEELQKISRVSVTEANIAAVVAPGSVTASVTLRQQKNEPQ